MFNTFSGSKIIPIAFFISKTLHLFQSYNSNSSHSFLTNISMPAGVEITLFDQEKDGKDGRRKCEKITKPIPRHNREKMKISREVRREK